MGVKVKDLAKFLEATDPECEVSLEVLTAAGWVKAKVDMLQDEKVGTIKLSGYQSNKSVWEK